jgi:hypothetical protein
MAADQTFEYTLAFLAARVATSVVVRRRTLVVSQPSEKLRRRFVTAVFDAVGSLFIAYRISRLVSFSTAAAMIADPSSYSTNIRVPEFDAHMRIEVAWYLATGIAMFVCGRDVGDRTQTSVSMLLHHAVAIALLQLSLAHNLTRLGMAMLPFLAASNPLLHLAKAFRAVEMRRASRVAFAAFAVVFTAGRIVAFPAVYIRIVATNGAIHWLPERASMYYAILGLCGVLYALQVFWFRRIVALLTTTFSTPVA